MSSYNMTTLARDKTFLEEGIVLSNSKKKEDIEVKVQSKQDKKLKNFKYFLRKKRSITLKSAPAFFKKHIANESTLDHEGKDKMVMWTVELRFVLSEDKHGSMVKSIFGSKD